MFAYLFKLVIKYHITKFLMILNFNVGRLLKVEKWHSDLSIKPDIKFKIKSTSDLQLPLIVMRMVRDASSFACLCMIYRLYLNHTFEVGSTIINFAL